MDPSSPDPRRAQRERASNSVMAVLVALIAFALLGRTFGAQLRSSPDWGQAMTIFVAVVAQALPFLVLGVAVSGLLAVFVTPERVGRLVPDRPSAAVCAAGLGGAALPGCECGSVPVAGRLMNQGVPKAAALTFLLAAPAINPVVLVATFVAFPDRPEMVAARFGAGLLCALGVGLFWLRFGRDDLVRSRLPHHEHGGSRWARFVAVARGDLLLSGSFLVLGAGFVAFARTVVPGGWEHHVSNNPLLAVTVMFALAVVLSLCSEADAFVAAAMPEMGPLPLLVFLTVGPVIDLKLAVMYAGMFGRDFSLRFLPLVATASVAAALLIGSLVFAAMGVNPW
ncbi:UPF0718 protein YcgR [Dietzia timorensis]|uniref:UPF0718 protein YcgR n=2 Tax=Dietzia timorensis TaxID=499555 RepID=A0A173LI40_9ACTN|nr:UPF0718 protein YcgR [Dietzia timorensis]